MHKYVYICEMSGNFFFFFDKKEILKLEFCFLKIKLNSFICLDSDNILFSEFSECKLIKIGGNAFTLKTY